jgi:hypothetical protein
VGAAVSSRGSSGVLVKKKMAKQRGSTGLGLIAEGGLQAPHVPSRKEAVTYIPPLASIGQANRRDTEMTRFAMSLMASSKQMGAAMSQWAAVDRGLGAAAGREDLPAIEAAISADDPNWEFAVYDKDGRLLPADETRQNVMDRIDIGASGNYGEAYESIVLPATLRQVYGRAAQRRGDMVAATLEHTQTGLLEAGTQWQATEATPTPVEFYEVVLDQSAEVVRGLYHQRAGEPDDLYQIRLQGEWYKGVIKPIIETVAKRGNMFLWQALDQQFDDASASEVAGLGPVPPHAISMDTDSAVDVNLGFDKPGFYEAKEDQRFYLTPQQRTEVLGTMQRAMYQHTMSSLNQAIDLSEYEVTQPSQTPGHSYWMKEGLEFEVVRGDVSRLNRIVGAWATPGDEYAWLLPYASYYAPLDKRGGVVTSQQARFTSPSEAINRGNLGELGDVWESWGGQPGLTTHINALIGGRPTSWQGMYAPIRSEEELEAYLSAGVTNDPNSPVFLTDVQRDSIRSEFLAVDKDLDTRNRIWAAANGGDAVVTDADAKGMYDYLTWQYGVDPTEEGHKRTGIDPKTGDLANGLGLGFQFANWHFVPPRIADTILTHLMGDDAEQQGEAIHAIVGMLAVSGSDNRAFDDLVNSARKDEGLLHALAMLRMTHSRMPILDPTGTDMRLDAPLSLEAARAQVANASTFRAIDQRGIDIATTTLGLKDDPRGGLTNEDLIATLTMPLITGWLAEKGAHVRGEIGPAVAYNVEMLMSNPAVRGTILNMYTQSVAMSATNNPQASKTELMEISKHQFLTLVGATFDLVVFNDGVDLSPTGHLVDVRNLSGAQRWWAQQSTNEEGKQIMRDTPWDLLSRYVETYPEQFAGNALGKIDGVSDLEVANIIPHNSGAGWVLFNSSGQVITYVPTATEQDPNPERQIFILDLPMMQSHFSSIDFVEQVDRARSRDRSGPAISGGGDTRGIRP